MSNILIFFPNFRLRLNYYNSYLCKVISTFIYHEVYDPNETEFFIKSADINSETKTPRQSDFGNDLFVRDKGQEYLIQTDELSYWSYRKEIIHTADLDNDGINEAIVAASDGGGHGKIKYFIISKRGENFYSVYESNNFMGCCLKILSGNILSVFIR